MPIINVLTNIFDDYDQKAISWSKMINSKDAEIAEQNKRIAQLAEELKKTKIELERVKSGVKSD